jgi:hypothetical protein
MRVYSDSFLKLSACFSKFVLPQVSQSQVVMSGVGARLQLECMLVMLNRRSNRPGLKLNERETEMRFGALGTDLDSTVEFL